MLLSLLCVGDKGYAHLPLDIHAVVGEWEGDVDPGGGGGARAEVMREQWPHHRDVKWEAMSWDFNQPARVHDLDLSTLLRQ